MAKKIDAKISLKTDGTGKVVADVHKVTDSVRKSTHSVSSLKKQLASINMAAKITAVAGAMSIVSGVVGGIKNAVGAVVGAVDGFASKADTIAKFSRNVGLSSEQLQQWRYAAERSGMSTENFDKSLRKFSVNVAKAANGEKKQLEIFNALGVSIRKENGEIKSNSKLMLDVADAYKKVTNAQDKLRISEELFGKGGMGFGTMFEGGAEGVIDLLDRRARIGGLVTAEDAKRAEDFKDLLLDIDMVKEAITNKAMSTLMPQVSLEFENFLKYWDANGDRILENVRVGVGVLVESFKELSEWVGVVTDTERWEMLRSCWTTDTATGINVLKGLFVDLFETITGNFWWVRILQVIKNVWSVAIDYSMNFASFLADKFNEVLNSIVGVAGSALDSLSSFLQSGIADFFDLLSLIPGIGGNFATTAESLRNQKKNTDIQNAIGSYNENRTTTNKLSVDFSGLPVGASVTPSSNFDSNVIDYSTGYTFGY